MNHTRSFGAALVALSLAACEQADVPVGVQPEQPQADVSQAQWTPDDEFARAARTDVPGFAGFYLEADGTPVVRMARAGGQEAARRYLAPHIAQARSGRRAGAARQLVFKQADYDFAQLHQWAAELTPLLQREGIYLVDVDEVENRVLLGVGDPMMAAVVRAEAARLGIPEKAVATQVQGKPETRATVRDRFTTTVGGIQIAFSSYVCTLGFNARRVSNGANVYVTNSHCTGTQNANDGIAIFQHTNAAGNQIGNEVADRANYACVTGVASCRRADAAYISNNGTRTVGQGGIARTAWATGGPGSLTVSGEYDIVARYAGTLPVGTYLDKTGRTSGSTYGTITNSCVTIGTLRCQDISSVWSEGGDSGSPVFYYLGGSGAAENDVQLVGVMWGGPNNNWNVTYSSRLAGIEADLGALNNLCRPGYGC